MFNKSSLKTMAVLFLLCFCFLGLAQAQTTTTTTPPTTVPPATTVAPSLPISSSLTNTQEIYSKTVNEKIRYQAFAQKADEEGFLGAASLFRAIAESKNVNTQELAKVILELGGIIPEQEIAPEVKTTPENISEAAKNEADIRDNVLPTLINIARTEDKINAFRAFNHVRSAATELARALKLVSLDLNSWKTKTDFYVCPVCGYMNQNLPESQCPLCSASKDSFKMVN